MPTTAELIQKENAALSKAKETYRNRVQKLEQNEFKRILKYLKQSHFFEADFSDNELQEGFKKMVQTKQTCVQSSGIGSYELNSD